MLYPAHKTYILTYYYYYYFGLVYIFGEFSVVSVLVSWYLIFVRVGIDVPTIEVRFEHLSVEAETHVGSRALPTLFSFIFNILEVTICNTQHSSQLYKFDVFNLSYMFV